MRSKLVAVGLLFTLLAACGGGDSDTAPPTSAVVPGYTAGTASVSVVMPPGSALAADKLTVRTSLGKASVGADGAATIPVYADSGSQLAVAVDPNGHGMMAGWVDATHTTISAQTTAHLMAYFALGGGHVLSSADAQTMIAGIPSADGIQALESTVQTALAADPDALAKGNADVSAALSTFASNFLTAAAGTETKGMLIQPETQSGVDVLQDPPYSAHLVNHYRRRGWAFVERLPDASEADPVPSPVPVTDFEIAPVAGVNGGVAGALADLCDAYWGVKGTAYTPVASPAGGTFTVKPDDDADEATFRVTVVGPGLSAGTKSELTEAQRTTLREVAIRSFGGDFVVPVFANIVLGSGALDKLIKHGAGDKKTEFLAGFIATIDADLTGYANSAPDTWAAITSGQWPQVLSALNGASTLRQMVIGAYSAAAGTGFDASAVTDVLSAADEALNATGGVLQLFDASVYLRNLAASDQADQFKIVVTPPKVKLTPASTQMGRAGTQVLTAGIQGVDDLTGASFHWTSTHAFGDLTEVGGGSRLHQTDYCSSSAQSMFTYQNSAADGATDTVTVEVFPGSNCDPGKGASYGKASATVTFRTQVTEPGRIGLESNDESFQVVVHFADVPGATYYSVHGEAPPGGGDPYYYGTSLDLGYDPKNPTYAYLGPIDHGVFLTGCSCDFSHEPDFLARFSGWTFTVTAYFN